MDVPQLRIQADRGALARYGMSVGQLAEAIDVAFNGEVVSQVLEEGRSYDLVVRFPEALRANADAIKKLEQVFKSIGKRSSGEKCDAIDGLLKEADGLMEEAEASGVSSARAGAGWPSRGSNARSTRSPAADLPWTVRWSCLHSRQLRLAP